MRESEQTATVAIKPCRSCGAGLIEDSRFCRLCGASQIETPPPPFAVAIPVDNSHVRPVHNYATTRLSHSLYHPVSGPLVNAVVEGLPASIPRSPASSLSKRILLTLMAIPIWVMIILLSPLDAYTSARIIGNRI